MADIKIISWNPQGLQKNSQRTPLKCDFLAKQYNHNNFDILSLQETHHKDESAFPQYLNDLKISHSLLHTPASINDSYAGIIVLIRKEWKILSTRVDYYYQQG